MLEFHPNCGSRIQLSNKNRTATRVNASADFTNSIVFSHKKLETNVIFQVKIDKRIGIWSGGTEIGVTTLNPHSFTEDNPVPQSATDLRNTWLMSSGTILVNGEAVVENYGFDLELLVEGNTVGLMRTSDGDLVYFCNNVSQGIACSSVPEDIYVIVNLYGKCAQISIVDVEISQMSTNTAAKKTPRIVPIVSEEITSSIYSTSENDPCCDKLRFHERCGTFVKLSNNFRTASRRMEEFNNAIVMSHRPLREDELFQVRIDFLVQKWSGSIEFGVTQLNPMDFLEFPATLTLLGQGTVVMSGNGILKDGKATTTNCSNFNLDQLQEGDRIGVTRNSSGNIHFWVNGEDKGISISGLKNPVYGCLNLYGMAGKCSLVDSNEKEEQNRVLARNQDFYVAPSSNFSSSEDTDILIFHPACGLHAQIINNGRTAHRPNAKDDFNHGVVLTNRILKPNELFEVVLDKVISKWAGGIEIGVTTHPPTSLEYPCTMTNVRSGTWIMTGNGIMHNGQSILDEYGQSLDKLKVGNRVGVLRKENGDIHFYINSVDQGRAVQNIPDNVYGVIDLYGQAAQVTINSTNLSNFCENNNIQNLGILNQGKNLINSNLLGSETLFGDLRFHHLHGRNARISNNGLTASRPNSLGEFNAAIVLSSRTLRDNELFEIIIERMVERWSGNLEAGVTTIRPEELVFPNTMTDVDQDCWVLSGSSLMSGGTTITNKYNCNLDSLSVGQRVGIMRKSDGYLHYFINSEDQGRAVQIPPNIYAVIDLYGQVSQVSITKLGDISMISSQLMDSLSLPMQNSEQNHRFSNCCGKNVTLKSNNLMAIRTRHYNHSVVFSALPLDDSELFEIRINTMKTEYAGCLSIGVCTLLVTDDYPVANLPSNINGFIQDTWYLTASQVRKNNIGIKDNYCVNLNRLSIGDKIGVSVTTERILKFYINGEPMDNAAYNLPKKLHVVVDLYGSTEGISIVSRKGSLLSPIDQLMMGMGMGINESSHSVNNDEIQSGSINVFSFDSRHGKNIELKNGNTTARRFASYNNGIVVSSQIIHKGTLFQVRIDKMNQKYDGNLKIGLINYLPDKNNLPMTGLNFKRGYWIICEDYVFQNGVKIKTKFGPNLDNLKESNIIGLLLDYDDNLSLFVNSVNYGVVCNVSGKCRALLDVYGKCDEISIVNSNSEDGVQIKDVNLPKEISNIEKCMEKCMEKPEISEKNLPPKQQIDLNVLKSCEYLNACIEFKNTLFIPNAFFVQNEEVICYCEKCHRYRGEPVIMKNGDPISEYTLPIGFVRFPVNINFPTVDNTTAGSNNLSSSGSSNLMMGINSNNLMTGSTSSMSNVISTWHIGYHGLSISHIRRIFDYGQLIPEIQDGLSSMEYFPIINIINNKKDEKSDEKFPLLYLSPSIDYASISKFSPSYDYYVVEGRKGGGNGNGKRHNVKVQVCIQVCIQPGSYKRSCRSFPKENYSYASLDKESIEWTTKEQNNTHISALLVKLNGF